MRSKGRRHRTAKNVIASVGAATAIALTIVSCALLPEGHPGAASRAASPSPTPTTTPTHAPTSAHLDEPASWRVYGDSLYRAVNGGVEFFIPGQGTTSYAFPDFDSIDSTGNLTVTTDVTFTGPAEHPVFVATGVKRTPAAGTTPERFTLVSISAEPGGKPTVHPLWELADHTYDRASISSTSSGPVAGIYQSSGSSNDADIVAGVNLDTGKIIWRYDEAQSNDRPMLDTMLVMVDRVKGFSVTGCWDGYGVNIATGAVLFTTSLDPCSYWSTGVDDYSIGAGQGNDYRVYDRTTGAPLLGWVDQGAYNGGLRYDPIGHLGVTGDYNWREDLRVFDTNTGQVLYTMPLAQVEALYLTAVAIWDGRVYATTTDAMIVIDGRSGEILADDVDWYPLVGVDGWTLYSDGLITSADRPLK